MASDQEIPAQLSSESSRASEATLDLKILSPSPGFPQDGINFRAIPSATTVSELRDRITATLPSHPPPDRQRLIYLGRVLQREDDSLATIFGETVIQQHAQRTLHLVLRDVSNQVQTAPTTTTSSLPRPLAPTQTSPSLIPRPSSVPPPQGTNSRTPSPFRPTNWPGQPSGQNSAVTPATSTPQRASPSDQTTIQQPQPRAQATNEQSFRVGLGNSAHPHTQAHAHVRATVTQNGQPVNLPPEVINQLLNQHFLRNGGLPEFFPPSQPRPPQSEPANQPVSTPPLPPSQQQGQGPNTLQQFMASVTPSVGIPGQLPMASLSTQAPDETGPSAPSVDEDRSRASTTQPTASDGTATPNPSTTDRSIHASTDTGAAQQQQNPQPVSHEASGVTPDGRRWTARTTVGGHEGHLHRHPQMPHAHFPMGVPQGFPPGFPLPMMQQGMAMPIPIPLAAPVAGLRPQGTPRSGSPARSVGEGPRRAGTPAAELQHRLMHTNQEIQNLQQLLSILAGGTMASGQPAPPLSEEQLSQIRVYADSMNAHIQGFGNDLNGLANTHPSVRFQPDYTSLAAAFNALQGQGRAITAQIQNMADANTSSQRSQAVTSTPPLEAAPPPPSAQQASAPSQSNNLPSHSTTPTTSSDTPSTFTLTPEISPPDPGLHLLSDPTNTQHYLLVGPSGPMGTGPLPLDVLYPLLATQLPHDQLVSQFTTATREMTRALQRSDLRNNMSMARRLIPSQQRQAGSSRVADPSSSAPAATASSSEQGPAPAPAVAQPTAQANIVRREHVHGGQAPARAQPPDEMRELLAPIIRNLWLIIRILVFGYFFFSSGKGYGRLAIIAVLGSIVWAVNAGMFGQQAGAMWEAVRRHFEEVVDEARGQPHANAPQQAPTPNGNGEGSSRTAGRLPTPEETARRLIVERAEGQRRRLRDVIRQAERTIALGLASLWPGVGEAVAQNAERVRREEERRRAEEEIKRKAEEEENKRRIEEEGKDVSSRISPDPNATSVAAPIISEASGSGSQVQNGEAVGRVNKGKERAE